ARQRGARARVARAALVHPRDGALDRGGSPVSARLRAALIWHDEVMQDVVLDRPEPMPVWRLIGIVIVVLSIGLTGALWVIDPDSMDPHAVMLLPAVASLVWLYRELYGREHGPTQVTLGTTGRCTFVTPGLGLPDRFAMIRPGSRGYLLTLRDGMRGTISIGGLEHSVAEFIGRTQNDGLAATAPRQRD